MKIIRCEQDPWRDAPDKEVSLSDVFYELKAEYQGDNIGVIEALQKRISILFSIFNYQVQGKSLEEAVVLVANQEIDYCSFKIEAD